MTNPIYNMKYEAMLLWAMALLGLTANITAVAFPRPQPPVKSPQKREDPGNYAIPSWVHAPESLRYEAMQAHLDSICNGLK